jgi:antitoxin component YwqK of YwqJK toxin-antitoxin module
MKPSLFFILLSTFFCPGYIYSQKFIERYFDHNWKETVSADQARFYSLAESKDSGWLRRDYFINLKKVQMLGLYEDKENKIKNGTFYWLYPNGAFKQVGKYIHNKKVGVWLGFYDTGVMADSSNYIDGNPSGISLSWYRDGTAKDSLNVNENGLGVYISWFDNGQPSSAGRYIEFNKQHGRWQYFHKNGKISAVELYDRGVLKDKQYFDESGSSMDTAFHDKSAEFPGGDKAWYKFLSKNLHFPSNTELANSHFAFVVISGIINEEGKVIQVEVSVPFDTEFDAIALKAVKNSPSWLPAINHNRKVYHYFNQCVMFSQSFY